MTTGKTIALTRWTFVGKVMFLLFKMLSRLVIMEEFLPFSVKRKGRESIKKAPEISGAFFVERMRIELTTS